MEERLQEAIKECKAIIARCERESKNAPFKQRRELQAEAAHARGILPILLFVKG